MIGVPGIGSVQIVMTYAVSGNIEALSVKIGFDMSMTVFGYTETCSQYYPTLCPVYVYEDTFNFGDNCAATTK